MKKHVAHSHHGLGGIALRHLRHTATACLSLALLLAVGTAALAQFDAETKLTAFDAAEDDWFGRAVAISGNTAIVGAHLNDDAGDRSGSAYLFDVATGNQLFKLTASDAAAIDLFGVSVGISGNTAIVGALLDDTEAGAFSGSAYLFDVTTGKEIAKLTASDAAELDQFGVSVAISGNVAIVGAFNDNDACLPDTNLFCESGSAYLFDVTTRRQLFKLTASDAAAGDLFGISVAINGNTAIVGAYRSDSAGDRSGSAYLFDVTTGEERFKLTASDGAKLEQFGFKVGISGNTAIVTAWPHNDTDDDPETFRPGSAYLFDVTTGEELFKLTATEGEVLDGFGRSVGISGDTAIVGADVGRRDAGDYSGSAYLFDVTTGQERFKLTGSDILAGDHFGVGVGISGRTAIVGASRKDDVCPEDLWCDSGAAYLFTSVSLPSDLTGNGFVDFEDLTILLANWNKPGATLAEGNLVDAEGTTVNFEDLTLLLADWTGPGPAGSPEAALGTEAVPEPSALLLAVMATLGVSVGGRRRRRAR